MAITETPPPPTSKPRKSEESCIQARCFRWLWNNFPETHQCFFAVINEVEGKMTPHQRMLLGKKRKERGVIEGVSDSLLLLPRGKYHGACIEAKTETGVQSKAQKRWQEVMERNGYLYILYFSEEEFQEKVSAYLRLTKP